jgi:hypothetical protein
MKFKPRNVDYHADSIISHPEQLESGVHRRNINRISNWSTDNGEDVWSPHISILHATSPIMVMTWAQTVKGQLDDGQDGTIQMISGVLRSAEKLPIALIDATGREAHPDDIRIRMWEGLMNCASRPSNLSSRHILPREWCQGKRRGCCQFGCNESPMKRVHRRESTLLIECRFSELYSAR